MQSTLPSQLEVPKSAFDLLPSGSAKTRDARFNLSQKRFQALFEWQTGSAKRKQDI